MTSSPQRRKHSANRWASRRRNSNRTTYLKWRIANATPDPDFKYRSNAIARSSFANSIATITRQGRRSQYGNTRPGVIVEATQDIRCKAGLAAVEAISYRYGGPCQPKLTRWFASESEGWWTWLRQIHALQKIATIELYLTPDGLQRRSAENVPCYALVPWFSPVS